MFQVSESMHAILGFQVCTRIKLPSMVIFPLILFPIHSSASQILASCVPCPWWVLGGDPVIAQSVVPYCSLLLYLGIPYDDINPGQSNSSLYPALGFANVFEVLHDQLHKLTAVSVLNTPSFPLNISMTFKQVYPPYPSAIHISSQGVIILAFILTHIYCIPQVWQGLFQLLETH